MVGRWNFLMKLSLSTGHSLIFGGSIFCHDNGTSPLLIGDISSNGCSSIALLVFRGRNKNNHCPVNRPTPMALMAALTGRPWRRAASGVDVSAMTRGGGGKLQGGNGIGKTWEWSCGIPKAPSRLLFKRSGPRKDQCFSRDLLHRQFQGDYFFIKWPLASRRMFFFNSGVCLSKEQEGVWRTWSVKTPMLFDCGGHEGRPIWSVMG